MPSKEDDTDAGLYTTRNDSDRGAAKSGRTRRSSPEEANKACPQCGHTYSTPEENTCQACGKTATRY